MYLCCLVNHYTLFHEENTKCITEKVTVCSVCLFNYQNLKEQQTQRTPQYDSLMQALITKMDPQLQSKLGVLSEKWIRVKEETFRWYRM